MQTRMSGKILPHLFLSVFFTILNEESKQSRLSDKNCTKLQNSIIVYVWFLFTTKSLAVSFDRAILKTT